MTMLRKLLLINFLLICVFANAQQPFTMPKDWTRDYKPFRIVGNLYYVGTYDLGCYLITTPKGHILINTGVPGSAPMIRSHVEALGFKFSDIKILLTTHAHSDHVGAMAEVKKMTGAKMMINEKDVQVLEDGGKSDYVLGGNPAFEFEPVKADSLLHDQDVIMLGDMRIVMLHHPGHTKGANSFLFKVDDKRVLIANMPSILDDTKLSGMPGYPDVGKDYAYTLEVMKKLEFDIWLSSHAGQFDFHEKHKEGDAYNPNVFMDKRGYDESLKGLQKRYDKKLGSK